MFRLMPERPGDEEEVERLLDTAFAPGRSALSSYTLRRGVAPIAALSLLARDDYDALVSAIRYWPVRIGPAGDPALLLGPIAVHPTRQGEGLGALMIGESLDRAAQLGWTRVILVGDEPYYGRFGFHRKLAERLDYPPPINIKRLLAKEILPGSMQNMAGMVRPWQEN